MDLTSICHKYSIRSMHVHDPTDGCLDREQRFVPAKTRTRHSLLTLNPLSRYPSLPLSLYFSLSLSLSVSLALSLSLSLSCSLSLFFSLLTGGMIKASTPRLKIQTRAYAPTVNAVREKLLSSKQQDWCMLYMARTPYGTEDSQGKVLALALRSVRPLSCSI